jgi:hypothetical protein
LGYILGDFLSQTHLVALLRNVKTVRQIGQTKSGFASLRKRRRSEIKNEKAKPRKKKTKSETVLCGICGQGDQIGRIFRPLGDHFSSGRFLKTKEGEQTLTLHLFNGKSYALILANKQVGLHFGRLLSLGRILQIEEGAQIIGLLFSTENVMQ